MKDSSNAVRNSGYLKEMGISEWQLDKPQLMKGINVELASLPDGCQLLLVSPDLPNGEVAHMFEKVLKSMNLSLDQSRHIFPHQLNSFNLEALQWIWFAGCPLVDEVVTKVLCSPALNDINNNPAHKRQLWQQICSYES
ncbi:DNA polymerase III subunit psi [Vibrio sp. S4M6]|uniref:DNA polymerase III subunit psi n=1 Tax=Vibrio sinus TaxID=2946865 RepID=UPI00202A625F|nr:DNA polymerase III subunit psi [Vibrio sinus]MCL9781125.1 DNA polymerase III subunit psi [Vibrio sinus]